MENTEMRLKYHEGIGVIETNEKNVQANLSEFGLDKKRIGEVAKALDVSPKIVEVDLSSGKTLIYDRSIIKYPNKP